MVPKSESFTTCDVIPIIWGFGNSILRADAPSDWIDFCGNSYESGLLRILIIVLSVALRISFVFFSLTSMFLFVVPTKILLLSVEWFTQFMFRAIHRQIYNSS